MNDYTIAIDIGSQSVKMIVAENTIKNEKPQIIHAVESPMHGFRHGYISDNAVAVKSFNLAIKKFEKISKLKIEKAVFSIGGVGMSSQYVRTNIDITKKDHEITESHISELIEKSEHLFSQKYPNKKILHIIPIKYLVDSRDVLGTPIGMYGRNLEIKIIFITVLEHHYDAFTSLVDQSGIIIKDIVAAPLANAESSITYAQKSQGCISVNIGSETTSLATFENNLITSLKIVAIGSNNITNDIALGLQTSLVVAEDIKNLKNKEHPKRKVDEIIQARLADILEIIEKHLKSIKKNRLLPAGIIYSGGGAKLEFLLEYTKKFLRLPAQKATIVKYSKKTKRSTNLGEQFSVAYGLCLAGNKHKNKRAPLNLKKVKKVFSQLFNQIMP